MMENEVLEFDIDVIGGEDDVDGDNLNLANDSSIHGSGPLGNTYFPDREGDFDLEPSEGMEFESEEAAKAFYNSYARRVGFSTRVSSSRRSRRDGAIIQRSFVCAKEGFRNSNEKRTVDREVKRPRSVTRVGCKASLSIKIHEDSGKWSVSSFVKEHNHELVPPDQVHRLRSHRQISGPAKTLIDTLQAAGLGPRRIMSALIKEYGGISKVGFTEVDCRNYMRNNKLRSLDEDIQMLLDYLRQMQADNTSFFYAVQGDDDQCTTGNVFWADPKAKANYSYFGDTVTFDTTYRSNRYRLPFAPFTGVNHHGQPVLFGCAFLINESEASFVWLFQTWLSAMSAQPPVSITTDHDSVIQSAIMQVFPETRHRFCKWHIFKKCQERMSHLFLRDTSFESDFHKCVNLAESIEEFESCWFSLVGKYDLKDHDWLQAIFSVRSHWVPVYIHDTFFAEMSKTQRSDSMNSYFDGYINASTNLNQFFKLYEKAVECRNEREVLADFDTMNTKPILRTPSPMEKQASELYTKNLFISFQDELVGTLTFMASKTDEHGDITTYKVSKFGEDHKAYLVRFNVLKMKVSCSCQMFEFAGILCRHVLAVFRVTNILTLPSDYILKRWTRKAKSNINLQQKVGQEFNRYLESHTVRYATLRHEAFKFVDEGSESVHSYNVAMSALEEALNKVASGMKKNANVSLNDDIDRDQSRRKGIIANHGSQKQQGSFTEQLSQEDMDKKICELTHELDMANRKCEAYRSNLVLILKDVEGHKKVLSREIHNAKLSMRDGF